MSNQQNGLPKEVVALVHHVELNGAGWWEKAVQRLIMGAIWLADAPPSFAQIKALLGDEFRLTLNDPQLTSALAKLEGTDVLRMPNGTYGIVEQKRKALEGEIDNTEKAHNAAKDYFCSIVTGAMEGVRVPIP
jgi:hypothetical protein